MSNRLLLFGPDGDLGRGIEKVAAEDKRFDEIFLFSRKREQSTIGNKTIISAGDLSSEDEVARIFGLLTPDKNSRYFMISTIGGFFGGKRVGDTGIDAVRQMFTLNTEINFLLAKHFFRFMEAGNGGSICFISAFTSFYPEAGKAVYGASKSALNYLIEVLALEGKERNITVNAVAPFILDTPENREWMEDVSKLVASDKAGRFILDIFENYTIVSGNIIKLPWTVNNNGKKM